MANPCGYNYNGKFFKDKKALMEYLNGKGKDKMISDLKGIDKVKGEVEDLKGQLKDVFNAAMQALQFERKKGREDNAKSKSEIKDLEGQVQDVFAAGNKAVQIERDVAKDLKAKRTALTEAITKNLVRKGKISTAKAAFLLKRIEKLNVNDKTAVDRFYDYAGKLFEDANYDHHLTTANNLTRAIKKLKSGKGEMTSIAEKFLEIDPRDVSDIKEYNQMAEYLKDGLKSSRVRNGELKFKESARHEDIMDYVDAELKNKEAIDKERLVERYNEEYKDIVGVEGSTLTVEELKEIMADEKVQTTPKQDNFVRSQVKRMFESHAGLIAETLKSGKDVFTGEDFPLTAKQKDLISRFTNMELDRLPIREAVKSVDALNNFLTNKSTTGIESVVNRYEGDKGVSDLVKDKGIESKDLKFLFNRQAGRVIGEQIANLKLLTEKIFRGRSASSKFEDAIGITDFENGENIAIKRTSDVGNAYHDKFFDTKPNNEDFNTENNIVERGMYSFVMRDLMGTGEQSKSEFNRRKGLVEHSIDVLSQGNPKQKKLANTYQEVYDKILLDSNSREDVSKKTDSINKEASDWFTNEWDKIYPELQDVSLNIHSTVLGKDTKYNPDVFKKIKYSDKELEGDTWLESSHIVNNGVPKKKAGVLFEATRPNRKGLTSNDYISLDFESNNFNAYKSALMDINTSGAIRKLDGAIRSNDWKKLITNPDDAALLESRIKNMVLRAKNKSSQNFTELSKAVRSIESGLHLAGTSRALGGLTQPIKQSTPLLNTLINTGGLSLKSIGNVSAQEFMNNSGRGIANRGQEALSFVKEAVGMLSKKESVPAERLIGAMNKANRFWLNYFLKKPDLFVARLSWMTYYEKSLKEQGIDTENIDYSTHKINEKAADYAQKMVDKNQQTSTQSQEGELYQTKDPLARLVLGAFIPFSKFNYNQKMRMYTDTSVAFDKRASKEDRKEAVRSLAATASEELMFKTIAGSIAYGMGSLAYALTGQDETEEEREKRLSFALKTGASGVFTDFFSPIPVMDGYVIEKADKALDVMQDAFNVKEDDKVGFFVPDDKKLSESFGAFGIAPTKAYETYSLAKVATTGEYEDEYGNVTILSKPSRNFIARYLVLPSTLYNMGLLPAETGTLINKIFKIIVKNNELSEEEQIEVFKDLEEKLGDIEEEEINTDE